MRLPDPPYKHVKHCMAHHAAWHVARLPRSMIGLDPRDVLQWENAKKQFPWVIPITHRGAGRQFLEFHRVMIRHYRWILAAERCSPELYRPWKALPGFLNAYFDAHFRERFQTRVEHLIHHTSDEILGSFLESTLLDKSELAGIHNAAHGAIGQLERRKHPEHPGLDDAHMDDMGTAHHNEHFWSLHGWIDAFYKRWQIIHGEDPDDSALDPSDTAALPHRFTPEPGSPSFEFTLGLRDAVAALFSSRLSIMSK